MECDIEFSSSEDEFTFPLFNDKITSIHNELKDDEEESSDEESDKIRDECMQEIRVIENEYEDDSDYTEELDISEWITCTEFEEIPRRIPFVPGERSAGPQVSADIQKPLDFFKLFFTDHLIDEIVCETNNYARRKLKEKTLSSYSIWRSWYDVTNEEFCAFIAVMINMGTMPLANIQEYWSRNNASYIPFYSNTFTRGRFTQIFWMLHLKTISTQNTNSKTRLQLVGCFLDYINSKFLSSFTPGEQICMTESIIEMEGRVSFNTHNPKESNKRGMRVYTMSDSNTGYICGILPSCGSLITEKLIRPDLPISARIPLHLYKMILDKVPGTQGHHMFTDNYYTSYILAQELSELKCYLTGSISTNKKNLSCLTKKTKFHKKSIVVYRKGDTLVVAWKDKRMVTYLTTCGNAGVFPVKSVLPRGVEVTVKKPNVMINHTKYMGGIKRANQYALTYCFLKKSFKWWRKLFFWGLEICLINSYILYKLVKNQRNERPLGHLEYLKTLVYQLRGSFLQTRDKASTSISNCDEIRLNGKLHIILTGVKRDCKVCSQRKNRGERHQTTYYCDTCPDKPRVHLGDCFVKYHTKEQYRT